MTEAMDQALKDSAVAGLNAGLRAGVRIRALLAPDKKISITVDSIQALQLVGLVVSIEDSPMGAAAIAIARMDRVLAALIEAMAHQSSDATTCRRELQGYIEIGHQARKQQLEQLQPRS